jgi:hypothetical protein
MRKLQINKFPGMLPEEQTGVSLSSQGVMAGFRFTSNLTLL